MHLFVIPLWINWLAVVLVVIVAYWKGGWRERLLATTALGAAVFSWAVCNIWPCWQGPRPLWASVAIAEDLVELAACLACVRGAKSYWVIWASAVTLLCFVSDLMSLRPRSPTGATGRPTSSWPMPSKACCCGRLDHRSGAPRGQPI